MLIRHLTAYVIIDTNFSAEKGFVLLCLYGEVLLFEQYWIFTLGFCHYISKLRFSSVTKLCCLIILERALKRSTYTRITWMRATLS